MAGLPRIVNYRIVLATTPRAKLPWSGPPMNAVPTATARPMDTWAHGRDVADVLGARRAESRA